MKEKELTFIIRLCQQQTAMNKKTYIYQIRGKGLKDFEKFISNASLQFDHNFTRSDRIMGNYCNGI